MSAILQRMRPSRVPAAQAVVEFLLRPREAAPDPARLSNVIETLCALLLAAGLPLDRYSSSTTMVTSEHDAVGRIWRRDRGVEQVIYVGPEEEADPAYLRSPFYAAAQSRCWVDLWLPGTPDDAFEIVPSLKAQGLTHYICVPFRLNNASDAWVTFATRHSTGFAEQDLLLIAYVLPALATRIDARTGWLMLEKLLRTYVGDEPQRAILNGRTKRGQVITVEAAMLVADMRDSTGMTADLSAVEAVGLFNELFDCLVPQIETRRGEVLKYLGDGLLAIFRETDDAGSACDRALDAARAALEAVAARNAAQPGRRPIEIGIALHVGDTAYGNVGSGQRLDFTVIGRDVALATRIAGMNGRLGQPILLSAPFAARASRPSERVGLYAARGFEQSIEVFRPAREDAGEAHAPASAARAS